MATESTTSDKYQTTAYKAAGTCRRCKGGGIYRNIGICFGCGGSGVRVVENGTRPMTAEEIVAFDEYQAGIDAVERRAAERAARRAAREAVEVAA